MSRLLRDGRRIGRSYEVERYLGEGAYSQVYRVRHRFLGRLAMKVLVTDDRTEQALGEAAVLARLGHPNVVRVFDADTLDTDEGERGYITTEYVAGGTLHEFRTGHAGGLVPVATAVEVLGQVCAGLAAAHRLRPPLVHRDLTPLNILVGHDGDDGALRARVGDFGLAVRADPGTGRASTAGTIAYKAPECLRDHRADSPAADVWAVGAIAHELLTGVLPDAPARSPAELNPEVDDALAAVVLDALRPDPTRRTPDAGALHAALDAWRERVRAPAVDPVEHAHRLARRPGGLPAAADLLERAIRDEPALAQRYGRQVARWRRGVTA
ncbi:serine/threonine-protein kinase [Pseudonocardia lacus]|uniref:serine/threonine-protein kinase n=1 Tax=Pseudonocardia lacus TaxID=2835865 RepID=UPI0027E29E88|nr:serine/threonine-protein kinase [Pseudonocardia lacus]